VGAEVSTAHPGRIKGCPPWCETDHGSPLSPVHMAVTGTCGDGLAAVDVLAEDDPARSPGVVLSYVSADLRVPAAEAEAFAGLLRMLGAAELAGHVERAAALVRG
jgi:hypothetical protein